MAVPQEGGLKPPLHEEFQGIMAEKKKFQAIKGTRDLLPPETELWNRVEATAREVFGTFGFGEIRPPILEEYALFSRSVGEESDIVAKELLISWDAPVDQWDFTRSKLSGSLELQRALEINWHLFAAQTADAAVKNADSAFLAEAKRFQDPTTGEKEFEQYLRDNLRKWIEGSNEWRNIRNYLAHVSQIDEWTKVVLRPEATASVCRAYIEHGMHAWAQPVKLYYMGPMFRRERPQKGRYRQFYQIGAEVLEMVPAFAAKTAATAGGADYAPKDAAVDAGVIEMVMTFFARLKLDGVQLEINSIGHAAENCRRGYVQKLKAALEAVKERLGPDSQRRIETNPLRVLDSKLENEQVIIAELPKIGDSLCDECRAQYAEVKRQLDLRGVQYKENWRLVRGLDYYMRTTFEITAKGLGSQNAVCGGGRYDGLVELLGGLPTKGIGFAIGEDRLILSLLEARKEVASGKIGFDVYVAWMGKSAEAAAIGAAQRLRAAGFRVELPPVEQKLGKALGQADKLGARYALILGEDEVASGLWTVKTLTDGTQEKMGEAEFLKRLKRGKALSS
jgi:histidyl-tRNA synthetase